MGTIFFGFFKDTHYTCGHNISGYLRAHKVGTIILGYFWIHMLGTTFLDIQQYSESDFLKYYILHWEGQPPYYLGIFIIQKKYNVTDFLQRGRDKAGG